MEQEHHSDKLQAVISKNQQNTLFFSRDPPRQCSLVESSRSPANGGAEKRNTQRAVARLGVVARHDPIRPRRFISTTTPLAHEIANLLGPCRVDVGGSGKKLTGDRFRRVARNHNVELRGNDTSCRDMIRGRHHSFPMTGLDCTTSCTVRALACCT